MGNLPRPRFNWLNPRFCSWNHMVFLFELIESLHIYIYIYIYIHIYIYTYINIHTITYIHTCMHAYIHTYMHTSMHTYIHTYIYIYIYIQYHIYIWLDLCSLVRKVTIFSSSSFFPLYFKGPNVTFKSSLQDLVPLLVWTHCSCSPLPGDFKDYFYWRIIP